MTVEMIVSVDKQRCKVLFDSGFAFVLYRGEINRFRIEEGAFIEEDVLEEIFAVLRKRARERLVHLLKASDKTEAQIRQKLLEGGYPSQIIEETLQFGKQCRYIDDSRYARRFAECSKNKSRKQIACQLAQKGVSRENIEEALECCQEEEEQLVMYWLRKKGYKQGRENDREYEKTAAFLYRKGFSGEIIHKAMEQWQKEQE